MLDQKIRIIVRRHPDGNDVSATYKVYQFDNIEQAIDLLGATQVLAIIQREHDRREQRGAIRELDTLTKFVEPLKDLDGTYYSAPKPNGKGKRQPQDPPDTRF
jgi:hypothetical protein